MKFFHKDLILEVPDDVYYPREDSILLAEAVHGKKEKPSSCLDMGCGSGFISILLGKLCTNATAADMDANAVKATEENAKSNKIFVKTIQSDLFSNIEEKFDLITFNPPYLPEAGDEYIRYIEKEKNQLFGGKTGRETIEKFLNSAKSHLNKNGKILFLISSFTGLDEVMDTCEKHGFSARIVKRKKIDWEELLVLELRIIF